jgi:hypothetical protein
MEDFQPVGRVDPPAVNEERHLRSLDCRRWAHRLSRYRAA